MELFIEKQINGKTYYIFNAFPEEDFMFVGSPEPEDPDPNQEDSEDSTEEKSETVYSNNDLKKLLRKIKSVNPPVEKPNGLTKNKELTDEYSHYPYVNQKVPRIEFVDPHSK